MTVEIMAGGQAGLMDITLSRETNLILGQHMYQSLSFLQMSVQELEECLRDMSLENVMLEEEEPPRPAAPLTYGAIRKTAAGTDAELPIPEKQRNTLKEWLIAQIPSERFPAELEKAVRFLIVNLDDRGYLPRETESCEIWQREKRLFDRALETLQGMDPAGVGARDLRECLCLQLRRAGEEDTLAERICYGYLEHLGRHHFNHIANALKVSEAEVLEAAHRIRELSPFPSNGFCDGRDPVWIIPDVEVTAEGGELLVRCLDEYLPHYCISEYYVSLLSSGELEKEEKQYLQEKMRQAKWALGCVRRRSETMLLCAREIVERQKEFFLYGKSALRPCYMSDVAWALGVHPSTVSRAVRNKYILCRWGAVPMEDLFRHEVGGDTVDEIVREIRGIIAAEDCLRPLSDNAISEKLLQRGYSVARRTVAKYREAAMIPPATGRKKRDTKRAG